MPLRTFRGIVRIDSRGAVLQTEKRRLRLIPYPKSAPIDTRRQEWMGGLLFEYLKNRDTTVRGEPGDGNLYNAHNWQPTWRSLT